MLDFIGGLIGSGTKLLGGIFSNDSAESIAQQNIANQDYLARNRIQMTVADAKAAGINPLAALGNATQSYSNVVGSTALGDSIGEAGQSLGRAIAATDPTAKRSAELEQKLTEAKIRNVDSDTVRNQAAASSIATKLGQPGTPPGIPLPPVDMRRVGPAYWAKPLLEDFVGPHGGVVTLPTAAASTASQNWMSMPGQIAGAAGIIGENSRNAYDDVVPGQSYLGAAGRAASSSQYSPYLTSQGAY